VSGNSDDYLRKGTCVAIKSFRRTNPNIPICVIYFGLDDEQKTLFDGCELIEGDISYFQRSALSKDNRPDIDESVFLRFNVDKLTVYDFAIYLDSDLVVLDDISDIFDYNAPILCRQMDNYPLSSQFLSGDDLLRKEGIPEGLKAINAGVIGIDLKYWRNSGTLSSVKDKIFKYGWDEFILNDQSLLNLVGYANGSFGFLPHTYNFMLWPDVFESKKTYKMKINRFGLKVPNTGKGLAKVIHWNGPIKPWHKEFTSRSEAGKHELFGYCYDQFV
jgi:lipopolysaccharide biosynthesis glycosyltransferase